MIAPAPATREALAKSHPEWAGWLRLLDAAAAEAHAPAWRAAARATLRTAPPGAPTLAGAVITIRRDAAERWTRRVLALGGAAGEAGAPLREAAKAATLDADRLLDAALRQDPQDLAAIAARLDVPPGPIAALAPVLVMPLLQAVLGEGRAAARPRSGWCPMCGAWPVIAELRGVEGERRLRCGRCGDEWTFEWLCCPFCGMRDHTRLAGLATETSVETRRVDTCLACLGYIKTVAALTPAAPSDVAIVDLATVDLDVVAMARGFRRPPGLGVTLATRVITDRRRWRRWIA